MNLIENQLGIKRGNPMDFQSALAGANPNYAPGTQYSKNCQRCVVAYELRRQGYDVQAKPKPSGADVVVSNAQEFNAFVDSDGSVMTYKHPTRGDLVKQLQRYPDGTRFAVRHSWKNTSEGHVYIAEKDNGLVVFYDPQNPGADAAAYINNPRANKFGYMQINGAELNPNIPLTEIVR